MQEDPNEIGTVKKEDLVNSLHKESPLPQLRTYQGDIAKFIKEKDQSAVTIALQDKEERERKQREQTAQMKKSVAVKLPSGTLRLVLSIFLVAAGALVGGYTYLSRDISIPVNMGSNSLVRADDRVVAEASNLSPSTLKETIFSIKKTLPEGDVMEIKVTDSIGKRDVGFIELLAKLKFNIPSGLSRSLGEEYMIGVYGSPASEGMAQGGSLFIVFRNTDYGIAFRDMLNWENDLYDNFQSILVTDEAISPAVASSLIFRDYIISNKDTRAAIVGGQVKLLYTFLDKNTVLITESASSLRGLVDAYSTSNLVR